jgi:hypothetical protein
MHYEGAEREQEGCCEQHLECSGSNFPIVWNRARDGNDSMGAFGREKSTA